MPTVPRSKSRPQIQYAALPFRRDANGRSQVMLITSRETRRWVIPKGWPMRRLKPHVAAAQEAYEEAGLKGRVGKRPIGSYGYDKRLKRGAVRCAVEVFPFEVEDQLSDWPEKAQRDRRWFAPEEAAAAVQEEGLSDILASLDQHLVGRPASAAGSDRKG
jgi:8-oxo-dGTP pyrophosphatase MutT (NUDIX family)